MAKISPIERQLASSNGAQFYISQTNNKGDLINAFVFNVIKVKLWWVGPKLIL